jgi:hypothetical protein
MMADEDRKDNSEALDDLVRSLYPVTRHFFDSLHESLLKHLCNSSLKLNLDSLDSKEIAAMIERALEQSSRHPERREQVLRLMIPFAPNSTNLAGSTLSILHLELNEKEARDATTFALSRVRGMRGLNEFERAKAAEWLADVDWTCNCG